MQLYHLYGDHADYFLCPDVSGMHPVNVDALKVSKRFVKSFGKSSVQRICCTVSIWPALKLRNCDYHNSRPSHFCACHSTDIVCQTVVQHCGTSDLELTATCCVRLSTLSLLSSPNLNSSVFYCFLLTTQPTCSASASVAA